MKKYKKILNLPKNTCYNRTNTEDCKRYPAHDSDSTIDNYSPTDSAYETFWQNLTITDDFIFGKIMGDPDLCIELLRRIFPSYDIERIEYIRSQETMQPLKDAKGIRLDVFVRDKNDVAF